MIGKFLMILLIVAVVYFFIMPRFGFKKQNDTKNYAQCSRCGVYCDIKEMSIKDGKYICKECECKS